MIAGLVLVVLELQQTRELVRAQLAGESWNLAYTRYTSLSGESPMAVLAKACDAKEELTTEDMLVIHNVFFQYLGTALRSKDIESIGNFSTARWKTVFDSTVGAIYSIPYGANWLDQRASRVMDQEMFDYYDKSFNKQIAPDCSIFVDSFRK